MHTIRTTDNLRVITVGCCLILLWLTCFEGSAKATSHQQVPVVGADAVTTPTAQNVDPKSDSESNLEADNAASGEGHDLYHGGSPSQQYIVQPGDTLWDVALEVGLDLASMPCAIAPTFQPQQPLVIGDRLEIPGNETLCHRVEVDETLSMIAARYGITPASITAIPWNQLATEAAGTRLPAGYHLRVPFVSLVSNTRMANDANSESGDFFTWMLDQPVNTSPFIALAVGGPFANQQSKQKNGLGRAAVAADQMGAVPENWPYGSGDFTWPLSGWLTQGYRYDHRALDVAAPTGTVVTAADRGVVIRAGWNDQGYGLFVVVDHNIDYLTLYGHLSEVLVNEGQIVAQGDIIGKVGSTGNSTGPHLHFEIRDFGRLANPLELLVH